MSKTKEILQDVVDAAKKFLHEVEDALDGKAADTHELKTAVAAAEDHIANAPQTGDELRDEENTNNPNANLPKTDPNFHGETLEDGPKQPEEVDTDAPKSDTSDGEKQSEPSAIPTATNGD